MSYINNPFNASNNVILAHGAVGNESLISELRADLRKSVDEGTGNAFVGNIKLPVTLPNQFFPNETIDIEKTAKCLFIDKGKDGKLGLVSDGFKGHELMVIDLNKLNKEPLITHQMDIGDLDAKQAMLDFRNELNFTGNANFAKELFLQKARGKENDANVKRGIAAINDLQMSYNELSELIDLPLFGSESMNLVIEQSGMTNKEREKSNVSSLQLGTTVGILEHSLVNAQTMVATVKELAQKDPEALKDIKVEGDLFSFTNAEVVKVAPQIREVSHLIKNGYMIGASEQDGDLNLTIYNKNKEPMVEIMAALKVNNVYGDLKESVLDPSVAIKFNIAGKEKTQMPPAFAELVRTLAGSDDALPLKVFSSDSKENQTLPLMSKAGEFVRMGKPAIAVINDKGPSSSLTEWMQSYLSDAMSDIQEYAKVSSVFNRKSEDLWLESQLSM